MLATQFGTALWSTCSAQPLLMILAASQSVTVIMSQPVGRPATSCCWIVAKKSSFASIFSS